MTNQELSDELDGKFREVAALRSLHRHLNPTEYKRARFYFKLGWVLGGAEQAQEMVEVENLMRDQGINARFAG